MKVILKQDVKKLGKKGDTVEVAEGYGRNFLIPRGLAVEATRGNIKNLRHERRLQEERQAREKEEAKKVKASLDKAEVVVTARSGEGGKLFGSVTSSDIAEAIVAQLGVNLDKRKIELVDPIKSVGTFPVDIKLQPGITATLTVKVEAEQ